MKKVRKIEIDRNVETKKLRVAAYCRVSTKYESQKSSMELQKKYYEEYIKEQKDWVFAGIYADYGSRGRIAKRTEFQKMIKKGFSRGDQYLKSGTDRSKKTQEAGRQLRTESQGYGCIYPKQHLQDTGI